MKVLQRLLVLPGIHFFATRFGPTALKRKSFDAKFAEGEWRFESSADSELVSIVEHYAKGSQILMLGCGTASIVSRLAPDSYGGFLGIDLSPVAIAMANKYANDKVQFQVGNMEDPPTDKNYGIVVFSESFYYVSVKNRIPLLRKLRSLLDSSGSIIITLSDPGRYRGIIEDVSSSFQIVESRYFKESGRYLLVFR